VLARSAAKPMAPRPQLDRRRVEGTEFQGKIWRNLLDIPYGEVVAYSELAQRAGAPKAARAVGAACGANPVPILVPCHRVIASDGSLGGFSCGLAVKRKLLQTEASR
jgi:O-6-methylguanine DNA methyltransferase